MAIFEAGDIQRANSYTGDDQLGADVTRLSDGRFIIGWSSTSGPSGEDQSKWSARGTALDSEGAKLADDVLLNDVNYNNYQVFEDVIALSDGGYLAVWTHADEHRDTSNPLARNKNDIWGQRFDANGNEIGEDFILTPASRWWDWQSHNTPAVTATDDGFAVVWAEDKTIVGREFEIAGTKTIAGDEFEIGQAKSSKDIKDPEVTGLSDGGYVVAWEEKVGKDWEIRAKVYDANGNTVGGEFKLNDYDKGNQGDVKITPLDNGGFVAVWESKKVDGSDYGIAARVYDADGNPVGDEFVVNSTTKKDQVDPDIVSLKDGGFVVVWNSEKGEAGGDDGIFGQAYNANGDAWGDEFQISSDNFDDSGAPKVEATDDGGFIVVWTSEHSDGDDVVYRVYKPSGEGNSTISGGAGDDVIGGDGKNDIINAGDGDDKITGGGGADNINAGADNDEVFAGADNDTVDGGSGDDKIFGGDGTGANPSGDDLLKGGDGKDTVSGGDGDDTISGGSGDDILDAGADNDSVEGGDGYDQVLGSEGADTLDGGDGHNDLNYIADTENLYINLATNEVSGGMAEGDVIKNFDDADGGTGDDTMIGNNNDNWLFGHEGNNEIEGGGGDDLVVGESGNDKIKGDKGNDTVWGDAGNDTLDGGDGDDEIWGGLGADDIKGGKGVDIIDYSDASGGVNINLAAGTGSGSDAEGDKISEVENVWGSDYNDTLIGDDQDNVLYGEWNWNYDGKVGNADDDTISGGDGDDQLFGSDGDDLLDGGADEDTLSGGMGEDTLNGGGDDDFLYGGSGKDLFEHTEKGDDIIGDFNLSEDLLLIKSSYGIDTQDDLDEVLSNNRDGDAEIDLGRGDSITLIGIDSQDFTIDYIV